MSSRVSTQDVREGLYRFGQWFGRQEIDFTYHRDPIANFLARGVVNDGLSKGFDVIAPGVSNPSSDDILPWNKELQKVLPDHYKEYLQTIYFQRRDGRALHHFAKAGTKLYNMAATKYQYNRNNDMFGKFASGIVRFEIDSYHGMKAFKLEGKNTNFYELLIERRDRIGEGMSIYEPIWDVLFAIYMLISHSAYFVARAGAGLKDVAVDEAALSDSQGASIISTLRTSMNQFGSAADTIIRPKTLAGAMVDFEIKTVDNPLQFRDYLHMYFEIISAHTGIPQSTLVGLVPGQMSGAEVNEDSYFDFLQDLQDSYTQYTKWFVTQLSKFYKFGDADFDILWRTRRVISEEEEITVFLRRAELATKLKAIGIKTKSAIKKAGIEISESDLKEGVDDPIDFNTSGPMQEVKQDEQKEEPDESE